MPKKTRRSKKNTSRSKKTKIKKKEIKTEIGEDIKKTKMEAIGEYKKETKTEDENHLAKWTAPEFVKIPQEMLLYYASVIPSILMIYWSFRSQEYVVTITFLVLIIAVIFQIYHEPRQIEYKIDLDGVTIGEKLYKYEEIKSFEMAQKGEENILKIGLKNAILPVREIHLGAQNPYYIQAAMEYFLPEKKQRESLFAYERNSEEESVENEEENSKTNF